MRRKLSYRIFLSESLKEKVLELLEQHPPEINNFKRDKLLYILSLIHEIPARNKRNGMSDTGYTNLNSTLLRTFVWDYKKYIDYLLYHGIINSDFRYIPGHKSRGFKVATKYVATVKPAYIQNPELIRKLKRYKWDTVNRTKQYSHLHKWMNGLEIDFASALDFIRGQYAHRVLNPDDRTWDYAKKRYKDPLEQYNSAYVNIHYLKDKRYYFFVDPNVGRLHTNLTNIQSDLRNFITWKGQPLVSIDISNSQPFLSTILFKPSFYETDGAKITCFSFPEVLSSFITTHITASTISIPPITPLLTTIDSPTSSLMLQKLLQGTDWQDVKLFIDLVEKGQIYEHLQAAFSRELGVHFTDRKSIKAAVFQVLFTDNRFLGQAEAAPKRIFKKLFPNVYRLFAEYKRQDSTVLPRLLQQIEALLILDIICKRIAREKPHIPIFTVHDSITTTVANLEYVQSVMREELAKNIGITPNLKTEYWSPAQLSTNPLNNQLLSISKQA